MIYDDVLMLAERTRRNPPSILEPNPKPPSNRGSKIGFGSPGTPNRPRIPEDFPRASQETPRTTQEPPKNHQNLNATRVFRSSLVLKFHSSLHSRIHPNRDLRLDLRFDLRLGWWCLLLDLRRGLEKFASVSPPDQ